MADPTFAELMSQLKNGINVLEKTRLYGAVNSPNFLGLMDTFVQSLEGDNAPAAAAAIEADRTRLAGIVGVSSARAKLDPILLDLGTFIDAPERSVEGILPRLFRYFVDNGKTVKTRTFVYGSPSASGTGSGTLKRLNKDSYNFDIENQTPDLKTFECIADAESGTLRNSERFQARASAAGKDFLQVRGAGESRTIELISDGKGIIKNNGLDTFSGTASAPTAITNFESLDTSNVAVAVNGTNFTFDPALNYLPKINDTETRHSLRLLAANHRLRQRFVNNGIVNDPLLPYYAQVAWNRDVGLATGTLTLRLGSQSVSVVLAAQTGWQVLALPLDTNSWYRNFAQENLQLEVDFVRTGGTYVSIDDIIVTPMDNFDGGWYKLIPGVTPFRRGASGKVFTFTDAVTEVVIQFWLWLIYGIYLPHSGAPTEADPT